MTKYFIQALAFLIVVGCNPKPKKPEIQEEIESFSQTVRLDTTIQNPEVQEKTGIIERYFPEKIVSDLTDTLLLERNLSISITKTSMDSYVINEYEFEGIGHIDKYRDFNYHIVITETEEVLIDTVFIKENYLEYTSQEFLDIAKFHGYWFNKIEGDSIELFGVINKPETDWSFAFYHNYNLTTGKFELVEFVDEEI